MYYCNSTDELSPVSILHRIINMNLRLADSYTYVICGTPGPTGKTWLSEALKHHGFNAIELSEDMVGHVSYRDARNHFIVNGKDNYVLIILNRPLNQMR